jgi:tRNA threonylcarbamoyl adenosine modification protein YeaZ
VPTGTTPVTTAAGIHVIRHRIHGVLLLAIDTSTPTVTAAVLSVLRPHQIVVDGAVKGPVTLLSQHSVTDPFAHAEQLMPLVHRALAESGHTLDDLEAVVVGLGPGPFTGLRVGIATAQALGDALDIPVHGVGSHDAIARSLAYASAASVEDGAPAGDLLVVTDARRREVYLSAYSDNGTRRFGPVPIAPAAVPAALESSGVTPVRMVGPGAHLMNVVLTVPVAPSSGPLGIGLVLVAARALLTGEVPGPLTPLYLRRPDATAPGARKSVLGQSVPVPPVAGPPVFRG